MSFARWYLKAAKVADDTAYRKVYPSRQTLALHVPVFGVTGAENIVKQIQSSVVVVCG